MNRDYFEIEADSEEEAKEKWQYLIEEGQLDFRHMETVDSIVSVIKIE